MDLNILSVSFNSERFLTLNMEYLKALNPDKKMAWYVVNNSYQQCLLSANFIIIPGASKPEKAKGGPSYHHAAGLSIGLQQKFSSRFLLILDPDFYLVRKNWIEDITTHMVEKGIAFLGSTWHPSQYEKYRYFPIVHCLFIDLEKINVSTLSFMPEIERVPFRKKIANRLPQGSFLCKILRATTSRDTGYSLYRQYYKSASIKYEYFTAHYNPPEDIVFFVSRILPDYFSLIPKKKGYFTRKRFLPHVGCTYPWEEFFWHNEPVAFHFRSYLKGGTMESEIIEARALLRYFTSKQEKS